MLFACLTVLAAAFSPFVVQDLTAHPSILPTRSFAATVMPQNSQSQALTYRIGVGIKSQTAALTGAEITEIVENMPAAASTLKPGDIVLLLNDERVWNAAEFLTAVRGRCGEDVTIFAYRPSIYGSIRASVKTLYAA